jgi:hypothetical protein
VAPRGRFELPTFRLTAERSTIELPGNVFILRNFMGRFKLRFGVPGVFLNSGSKVWCFFARVWATCFLCFLACGTLQFEVLPSEVFECVVLECR